MKQDVLTSAEISLTGDHGYIHEGYAFSLPVTDVDLNLFYYEEYYQ